MRWFVGLVLNQKKTKMDRLEKLQLGIDIVEGIKWYQGRVANQEKQRKAFLNAFGSSGKTTHNIEIYTMCITRLEERYTKLINQL